MMTRRRFITVAAAALPGMAGAAPQDWQPLGRQTQGWQTLGWQGQVMGADASITLTGAGAAQALVQAEALLRRVEALFSLYDPASELSRLNAAGQSGALDSGPFHSGPPQSVPPQSVPPQSVPPSSEMLALLGLARRVHQATGGLFDPTVQPLWQALATGGDANAAAGLVGFDRVQVTPGGIRLGKGQALTLNGIAQGYATDLVRDLLAASGFGRCLINIGEYAALGGPWAIGIEDPAFGLLATRALTDAAIATSSPGALRLADGSAHILHPARRGLPRWSTVSVQADSAALADGLSTALCFADAVEIRAIRGRLGGVGRVTVVDLRGDLATI